MLKMFVFKHNLIDESAQPDTCVGRYQMHQRKPHDHFVRFHLHLHTQIAYIHTHSIHDLQSLSRVLSYSHLYSMKFL